MDNNFVCDRDQYRQRHIGRLLLRAHQDFSARALEGLQTSGYPHLSLAHIGILPFLNEPGIRTTVLAKRAGMTKQGMGQHLETLVQLGYVERIADPDDGRAFLVRFTHSGGKLLSVAIAVTDSIEADYAALIGVESLETLKRLLEKLSE